MATKPVKQAETTERTEEQVDSPILDSLTAPVRKMVARGKERGYVTYDELNKALPSDEVNSEQIEDTMTMLSEMGINVIESEESEENTTEEQPEAARATAPATVDEDDLGRTDDPVRMYLREMGSVELLSREGEIAIAKRIEAGRQTMIGGICESPLTMRAIIEWRDQLREGTLLLRDVIDLEATYGGGPEAAANRAEAAKAADESAGAAPGTDGTEGADGSGSGEKSESDDDFDEGNVSLSAMEAAVRPTVIETFDAIAASYKKFRRLQDLRLELAQKNESLTDAQNRRYRKLKRELIELMQGVRLNNNRIEASVDELYGLNRGLMNNEGRLLRLAVKSGRPAREVPQALCRPRARPALGVPRQPAEGRGLEGLRQGEARRDPRAPQEHPGHRPEHRPRARRVQAHRRHRAEGGARGEPGQEGDGRGEPPAGDLDRQEVHQPRPSVPGPDPGGQHRPDEGGGQVRVPARLQVLDLRHLVDSPGDHALDRGSGAPPSASRCT